MNLSPHINAAVPQDRYAAALQVNREVLERDLSATTRAYQETIQLQQEAQNSLREKIVLLQDQLANAQSALSRSAADLDASKVATAALMRQNTSQQEELAQLGLKLQAEKQENAEMLKLFGTLVYSHSRCTYLMHKAISMGGLSYILEIGEYLELYQTTIPKIQKECEEFLKKNHPDLLKNVS